MDNRPYTALKTTNPQHPVRIKLAILISGEGSNLLAIIKAIQTGYLPAEIVLVFSNVPKARGLQHAYEANLSLAVADHNDFSSRQDFDNNLIQILNKHKPNYIILAGFMRKLTAKFVKHYKNKILNIHPALLPNYPGMHTHKKVLATKEKYHGTTVHLVTEHIDAGPIIAQSSIPIFAADNENSLKTRIKILEHKLYPTVLKWLATGKYNVKT
jgi:phosphoribosylglycinamide formyltransferase 1